LLHSYFASYQYKQKQLLAWMAWKQISMNFSIQLYFLGPCPEASYLAYGSELFPHSTP
jgi:hypothetical protein